MTYIFLCHDESCSSILCGEKQGIKRWMYSIWGWRDTTCPSLSHESWANRRTWFEYRWEFSQRVPTTWFGEKKRGLIYDSAPMSFYLHQALSMDYETLYIILGLQRVSQSALSWTEYQSEMPKLHSQWLHSWVETLATLKINKNELTFLIKGNIFQEPNIKHRLRIPIPKGLVTLDVLYMVLTKSRPNMTSKIGLLTCVTS